jgi:hypothetical protein
MRIACAILMLAVTGLPAGAAAMTALPDDEMSAISGADGVTISLGGSGLAMDSYRIAIDSETPAHATAISANDLDLVPAGAAQLDGVLNLDAGGDAAGTAAGIGIDFALDRARLSVGSMMHSLDSGRSYGNWALVGDTAFRLVNRGLMSSATNDAALYVGITNADFFYQQNWYYHSNITLHDLDFIWDMPYGSVGITNEGLRVAGDTAFRLNFDLMYKFHPDQDMATVTGNDKPMVNFGWTGMLYDSEVLVRGGGAWTGAQIAGEYDQTARTEGLNLSIRWNYKPTPATTTVGPNDLRWQIGRAGGNHALLEFGDWRNLESASGPVAGRYGFDFPSITYDAIPAGSSGPGGLCWGGPQHGPACSGTGRSLLELTPGRIDSISAAINRTDAGTFAWLVRNGNLFAWSNDVAISSDIAATETYDWGLIYTLANINANIYFYPGGSESDTGGGSRNQGVVADVLFSTQTFDMAQPVASRTHGYNWEYGSHFLIADTSPATNMGIGLLGSSYLFAADDLRLWLKNTWAGTAYPHNYDGGIDMMSPRTRIQLKGLFGGARLPGGLDVVSIANIDLNVEGFYNARLSPPPDGENYLAYSAAMRIGELNDATGSVLASSLGSYLSIEEPARPGVDLRWTDMSGDVAWTDGRLELVARGEQPSYNGGRPILALENTILVGATAATRLADGATGTTLANPGQVLSADIQFGGRQMTRAIIPAATLQAGIELMPKY